MHDIEMHSPSKEFSKCWQAAGRHLDSCARDVELGWLKASLIPPFLEHLSFRIANQLFFIRLIDVAGRITTPGNPRGLLAIAKGCRGHACLMPMAFSRDGWKPVEEGWGLVDIRSKKPLDPALLVTEENIEMTNWELQDFFSNYIRN